MTRIIHTQNQFNGGEYSPRVYARSDLPEYAKGLQTQLNARSTVHGPVLKRNGFKYIAPVKDSTKDIWLLHFQFSRDDGVIIEAGDNYFRFFADSGQVVESSKAITGASAANPCVITAVAHGYSAGDQVYITGIAGMTELNNSTMPYIVGTTTANTFELKDYDGNAVNSTAFTAYSSGGVSERIYTLTTPWSASEVEELSYAQFGDILYVAHPNYAPRVITRISNTNWTITELKTSPPPTYESGYAPPTTCTPAATTGNGINFTAGAATFLSADVGRQIVNMTSGQTGIAIITSITSTTVAVCDIVEDFTSTAAITATNWRMDLSPLSDLEFSGTYAGQVVTVTTRYPQGYYDTKANMSGATQANPCVVTSNAHPYVNGNRVKITDVVGMTNLNNNTYTVNNVAANTFELLGTNSTGYVAYSSGGIVSKLRESDLRDTFRSSDVGKYIIVHGGVLKIIAYTSATSVDCEILKTLGTDDRTGNWTMEVPAWDATRGYPRAVCIYQGRLIFGGTVEQPQTLWFSELNIYDGFGGGSADTDAITVDLGTTQVNQINWLAPSRDLIVGTSGGEMTVNGGGTGVSITPTNIAQIPRTYYGSNPQQPILANDEIMFLQSAARKIRSFQYSFQVDNYQASDINFIGEHLTEGGMKRIAYAQEPDPTIYAVMTEGRLLGCTYKPDQKVIGWYPYETDGSFDNIQTISQGAVDQVWVVVSRVIDGKNRKYLELLDNSDGTADTDGFSDCYLNYSVPLTITGVTNAANAVVTINSHGLSNGDRVIIKGITDPAYSMIDSTKTLMSDLNQGTYTVANATANTFTIGVDTSNYNLYGAAGKAYKKVTTISGLGHLEGKTVEIKTDGAAHPARTVSSGSITLQAPAGEVCIGLPYIMRLKTLTPEFSAGAGSMQGQQQRNVRPVLRVYNSMIPTLNGQFRPSRSAADRMDQKVPLFTGYLYYGPDGWGNLGQLLIEASGPFPLHLQAIFGTIEGGVK